MRIDLADAANVLGLLLEGMSIRTCERRTGMNRDTICDLILHVGSNCETFLIQKVKGVAAKLIEMDEIWGFVHCKAKTAAMKNYCPKSATLDVACHRRRIQVDPRPCRRSA
jgi:hypothetical protein